MPSRRTHTKSRHGCSQCKAAHIKCDLAQPTCGKCTRSGRICQFPNLVDRRLSNRRSTSSHRNSPEISSLLSTLTPPDGTPIALGSPYPSEAAIVPWDDLELLHHYLTVTYKTLASRNDLRQMWQLEIPKLALKQKFLMHSLFSVAALHIASSHPPNLSSYIDRAIRHHNIALQEYSYKLENITQENSASLLACATLIVIFALNLAVSRPHKEFSGPIEEMLGIFTLLRGVPFLLGESWCWIQESEIGLLFAARELEDIIMLPDDVTNALKLLEERNQLSSKEGFERDTYARAIRGVKGCFEQLWLKDRDNGMVLSWPISVSQEYITLLASRQQMALVILAHYAVVLNEIRDTWWANGWGYKLVQEVSHVVEGDLESLIVWPMDKIVAEI
ncbi:hypothetical protein N431DRAFT_421945 [Stipitochalara longipes BDJ]|nr:hypothetical protein N431DRAFT_421945 [Stipitochalara longipes BDJ]